MESLNNYPQYQDYFVLDQANVNDYIFIYYTFLFEFPPQYTGHNIYKNLSNISDPSRSISHNLLVSIQRVEY